jgi:hypothetical protein
VEVFTCNNLPSNNRMFQLQCNVAASATCSTCQHVWLQACQKSGKLCSGTVPYSQTSAHPSELVNERAWLVLVLGCSRCTDTLLFDSAWRKAYCCCSKCSSLATAEGVTALLNTLPRSLGTVLVCADHSSAPPGETGAVHRKKINCAARQGVPSKRVLAQWYSCNLRAIPVGPS